MGRFLPEQSEGLGRNSTEREAIYSKRPYILLVRQTHEFHGHGVLGCVMSGVFELESSEAPSQFYTTFKRKIYHNFFLLNLCNLHT